MRALSSWRLAVVWLFVLSSLTPLCAQESEPEIVAAMAAAEAEFDKELAAAKSQLLAKFDQQIRAARGGRGPASKKAEKIQQLTQEKEAFERDATLPLSREMKLPLADFERAVRKAQGTLEREYERGIRLATNLKADTLAADLLHKKNLIENNLALLGVESLFELARMQKGSVWKGTARYLHPSGKEEMTIVLTILESDGKSFKGRSVTNGRHTRDIEGTISGGLIQYSGPINNRGYIHVGRLKADLLETQWTGTGSNGTERGVMTLKFQRDSKP